MSASTAEPLCEEWLSKLCIEEQLHRWARGADRIDLTMMQSVFHPRANINYGYTNGPVEDFLPWVVKFHTEDLVSTAHIIVNVLIDLDGERASSEAGVDCRLRYRGRDGLMDFQSLARYLDRWERRSGAWKIVDRVSVLDSYRTQPVAQDPAIDGWVRELTKARRDSADLSYRYIATPGR